MCYFKIIINKSECTKAAEVLLPTCLVPDAIKKKLIQHFTFLTSNRYGSRLGRMLELSMVTFGSCQIPIIFLQHLQNIFDFVLFHTLNVLITQAKVRIIILSSKYLALKVLKPVGTFYRFASKNPLNPIGCGFEILLVL